MKILFLTIVLTLAGCASELHSSGTPPWFKFQGTNLTECGPTYGAMVVERFTGRVTTRHEARAFDRQGVNWFRAWSLGTIRRYLDSQDVGVKTVRKRLPVGREVMVVYVDGNHFLMIERHTPYSVLVYDSLAGRYTQLNAEITTRLSGDVALVIGTQ